MSNETQHNNEEVIEFKSKEEIVEYLLHGGMKEAFEFDVTEKSDCIIFPEIDMVIKPYVEEFVMEENASCKVTLRFDMYSNRWKKDFTEVSSAVCKTAWDAVGMALMSFSFGFVNGLKALVSKETHCTCESKRLNEKHNWNVYLSNIVGMGQRANYDDAVASKYWDLIKNDIIKRLGNQRVACIKIYASKIGEEIVGECRIDDVPIKEIGDKIGEFIKNWSVELFAADKQFIFLEQDEATIIPNPYEGKKGEERLKEMMIYGLKLFMSVNSEEDYYNISGAIADKFGDMRVAYEIFAFIPEMCALNAFYENIRSRDEITFARPDGTKDNLYMSQVSDYRLIQKILFEILGEGIFGEKTNDLYKTLIMYSSVYSVVMQMNEKGSKLSDCVLSGLAVMVDDNFKVV